MTGTKLAANSKRAWERVYGSSVILSAKSEEALSLSYSTFGRNPRNLTFGGGVLPKISEILEFIFSLGPVIRSMALGFWAIAKTSLSTLSSGWPPWGAIETISKPGAYFFLISLSLLN